MFYLNFLYEPSNASNTSHQMKNEIIQSLSDTTRQATTVRPQDHIDKTRYKR